MCGVYDGTPYRGNQDRALWTQIFTHLACHGNSPSDGGKAFQTFLKRNNLISPPVKDLTRCIGVANHPTADGNHIDIRFTHRFGGHFHITQGLAAIDFTSLLNSG